MDHRHYFPWRDMPDRQLERFSASRMTMDEYIEAAARTDKDNPQIYYAIGLAEEGAEVLSLMKKHVFHGHPLDREKIIIEMGDVAWNFFRLCAHLNVNPEEVFAKNNQKLRVRYPDGFSTERSIRRLDEQQPADVPR